MYVNEAQPPTQEAIDLMDLGDLREIANDRRSGPCAPMARHVLTALDQLDRDLDAARPPGI
jgi:hypothetical protein